MVWNCDVTRVNAMMVIDEIWIAILSNFMIGNEWRVGVIVWLSKVLKLMVNNGGIDLCEGTLRHIERPRKRA